MKTLDELVSGQSALVRRIGGSPALRKRLLDMGFTRGVSVKMVKRAPLRDPLEIELKGFHVGLRATEARAVGIEPTA